MIFTKPFNIQLTTGVSLMKRKIVFLIAVVILLSICACTFCACPAPDNSSNNNQNQNNNVANNGMKHYEISLNKDNFEEYIEYKVTIPTYAPANSPKKDTYEFKGALSYAYYKDVTITYYAEYSNSDGLGGKIVNKGSFTVKLNAAGNYIFYTNDEKILKAINCSIYTNLTNKNLTITAVSGTVIFDI